MRMPTREKRMIIAIKGSECELRELGLYALLTYSKGRTTRCQLNDILWTEAYLPTRCRDVTMRRAHLAMTFLWRAVASSVCHTNVTGTIHGVNKAKTGQFCSRQQLDGSKICEMCILAESERNRLMSDDDDDEKLFLTAWRPSNLE